MKNILKYAKNLLYILVLISIATMVSGCSLRKQTTDIAPKVFTIWSFEDEDVWKPIIKDIQKELKGYEIRYFKKTLNDTYENDALNSILSGDGPDIWAIPSDWVYRHKDKLAPMPDTLIKDSKINLDDQYVPLVKDSVSFDDKIYGLIPTIDSLVVYYNTKLFDSALEEFNNANKNLSSDSDATREAKKEARSRANTLLSDVPGIWNDFIETVKLITLKNGTEIQRSGLAFGTTNNISYENDILSALMLQNGTSMLSTDLSLANFNLPQDTAAGTNDYPAARALDFYTSFANPASPNYSWNSNMSSDVEAFANSKAAMIIAPDSLSWYLAQNYPSFKFKKAPLPQISSNSDQITDYANATVLVSPKLSNNFEAAWQFIYELGSNNYGLASTLRLSSPLKKKEFTPTLADRFGSSNPGSFQNQTAKNWVKGRYPGEVNELMRKAIDDVNAGRLSSQAALDNAALLVTNLLKKENW